MSATVLSRQLTDSGNRPAPAWHMNHMADIAERSAFLQHCEGLSEIDAIAQVAREAVDQAKAIPVQAPGILGEVIAAARRRTDPAMADLIHRAGLAKGRQPLWGLAIVVGEGGGYRPALPLERGSAPAVIVPIAGVRTGLVDLAAQSLASGRMATRLGVGEVVGLDEIDRARETGAPLLIFDNVTMWLRAGTRGAVIIDWTHIVDELEGIVEIRTTLALAPRVHAVTRRCWPRPKISIPIDGEVPHAA